MSADLDPQDLEDALRGGLARAHVLAARLMAQVADGDLSIVDRETAETRARLAIQTAGDLERSLTRLQNTNGH